MFRICHPGATETLHTQVYSGIANLPEAARSSITGQYLQTEFLEAFERALPEDATLNFMVVFSHDQVVGLAMLQGLWVEMNPTQLSIDPRCGIHDWGLKLMYGESQQRVKVWGVGNAFLTGNHGIWMAAAADPAAVYCALQQGVQEFVKGEAEEGQFILFKDIHQSVPTNGSAWKGSGYTRLEVEPNMVLSLSPTWNAFSDYLLAFKSKFRVKAKKALQLSQSLRLKDLTAVEIESYLPRLQQLYKAVEKRADYSMGQLDLKAFIDWKARFGDAFLLRTFWLKGKMVGFLSGFMNGTQLDAHFVGLDYAFNREYGVYQRMLYEYVALGIEKGVTEVHFGRTAGEIKSTLGAVPQTLTCYVRHPRALPNHFVRPIVSQFKPRPFPLRKPFKVKYQVKSEFG